MLDWQMYDAGLFEPIEQKRADEALRSDPNAQRELDGLRSFKALVRNAGLQEPVPYDRLQRALKDVVGSTARPRMKLGLVAAAVIASAAVLAFAATLFDTGRPSVPNTATKFSSPVAARDFAVSKSKIDFPAITLSGVGKIKAAHAHLRSACLDFEVDGQIMHVRVQKDSCSTDSFKAIETASGTVFVDEMGQTTRFSQREVFYSVYGGDEKSRVAVATKALAEVASAPN